MSAPFDARFIHRQTLAGQIRFTTTDLSEIETRILNAGFRALEMEKRIFEDLRQAAMERAGPIGDAARALAELDVAASHAELAGAEDWRRPVVTSDRRFAIEAGRHPVVERALKAEGGKPFIANDCDLSAEEDGPAPIWLTTGPNMAGKSTFLRQNALIAILAQMGAFVPAQSAGIGVVDRLFSRVGAADDLARGRSTFMVEMVETAAILNQAGPRALVILDEIGRGTATYDGLSIAWAVLEHLHESNRCRGLFATPLPRACRADRNPETPRPRHRRRPRMGGRGRLPARSQGGGGGSLLWRAGRQTGGPAGGGDRKGPRRAGAVGRITTGRAGRRACRTPCPCSPIRPPPDADAPMPTPTPEESAVEKRLAEVDPDSLTPREALEIVYELRRLSAPRPDNSDNLASVSPSK